MSTDAARSTPGRPRDPDVDRRLAEAAVELYGEAGWAGFSIDAVARRAGVGKASVYLRWSNREELLADALRLAIVHIAQVSTGSVRGDLIDLARQFLELYLGPAGRASLRLGVEVAQIPGLLEWYQDLGESQRLAARRIVRRAIEHGELPRGTSTTLVLDTLCGGAMFHAMTVDRGDRDRAVAGIVVYAQRLADFVLNSALTERRAP